MIEDYSLVNFTTLDIQAYLYLYLLYLGLYLGLFVYCVLSHSSNFRIKKVLEILLSRLTRPMDISLLALKGVVLLSSAKSQLGLLIGTIIDILFPMAFPIMSLDCFLSYTLKIKYRASFFPC